MKAKVIDKIIFYNKFIEVRFEKIFDYKSGQFIGIKLPIQDKKNILYFSIFNDPLENYISILTNIGISEYKKYLLNNLKIGDELEILGPNGNMVLDDKNKNIVFIAGGLGITPIMSMIRYIVKLNLDYNCYLFYSIRYKDDFPYLNELLSYKNKIKECITITREKVEGFMNERLDYNKIKEFVNDDLNKYTFYIVGSNNFVLNLRKQLLDNGVYNIKIELFGEYE